MYCKTRNLIIPYLSIYIRHFSKCAIVLNYWQRWYCDAIINTNAVIYKNSMLAIILLWYYLISEYLCNTLLFLFILSIVYQFYKNSYNYFTASNTTQLAIAQQNLANNLAQQTQSNIPLANQQLTSTAQQLALAATAPQQLLAQAQQNLASSQQMALTAQTSQITAAINTSQAIAMSNASQPMVSYPIMTQSVLQNGLPHWVVVYLGG